MMQEDAASSRQRAATHQRIANALRHGEWLSTPAIAERLNTSPGLVRKRLMEMRAEGDVERRTVSGPHGVIVVEWRLA